MSSYQNVVGGKLKLKGKALDVKSGGIKKKKKQKHNRSEEDPSIGNEHPVEGLWHVNVTSFFFFMSYIWGLSAICFYKLD
jgi:FAM32A